IKTGQSAALVPDAAGPSALLVRMGDDGVADAELVLDLHHAGDTHRFDAIVALLDLKLTVRRQPVRGQLGARGKGERLGSAVQGEFPGHRQLPGLPGALRDRYMPALKHDRRVVLHVEHLVTEHGLLDLRDVIGWLVLAAHLKGSSVDLHVDARLRRVARVELYRTLEGRDHFA